MDRDAVLPKPPDDYGIYVWFLRFSALLDTMITILVIYLIFKCTPKAMKVYKWFLLNLSLCCYLLDIHITVIFIPLPLYPTMGECAIGLSSPLGYMAPIVSFLVMAQLTLITGVSVLLALVFRLASVHGKARLFERKSVIFVCIMFQFCFGLPILIGAIWIVLLPEEEPLDYMRKSYPSLLPFYQSHPCAVMFVDYQKVIQILYIIIPTMALFIVTMIAVLALIARHLSSLKHNMSAKTYKMHKSLTISLCFQFGVPACMLFLSDLCNIIVSFLQHHVEPGRVLFTPIFCASMVFSSLHTFGNGVIMIAFVKPYREACSDLFCSLFRRGTSQLVLAQETLTRSNLTIHRAKVTPRIVKSMNRPSSYPK